jgi:hypothetical protein
MIGNNFARWYNVNEGTFYSEFAKYSSSVDGSILCAGNSSGTEELWLRGLATAKAGFSNYVGNVQSVSIATSNSYVANQFSKVAAGYKVNDYDLVMNSGTVVTDTVAPVPSLNDRFTIGSRAFDSGTKLNGTLKRIAFYSRKLSPAEEQGITS